MFDLNLTERIALDTDWASILFIFCAVLITVTKAIYTNRFNDFYKIATSNKYFNVYGGNTKNSFWFDILFNAIQFLSYSFFLHLILDFYTITNKYNFSSFLLILALLFVLKIIKYSLSLFVSHTFDISKLFFNFYFQKNSYKNLISIYLLPVNILLFFNDKPNPLLINTLLIIVIGLSATSYLSVLKTNLNQVSHKIVYFFLYLCTLEIAPYIALSYWFIDLNEKLT